jgi:CRP/FNR family transcriptional regulator, cyclic AMP receptor protein
MGITLAEEVKLLAAVDCLKPLSKEELEEFAKGHPDGYFEPGEIISTPWEEDERLLILKKGRVRIYRMWHGREQTLAHVEHGTVLATHRLHGSYVEAMEPVIILPLAKEGALRLIERHPEVAWQLIEGLTKRMRRCDERLADIALKKTPVRLASVILQLVKDEGVATPDGYSIPTRYTHDELGIMIGARRVAITRALGKLQGEEAVEVRGHLIYVTDLEALKHLAEAG